eukprot:CAMPEP_0184541068 /NCGR_PEP_ID=MMETSP0199_2-20130426/1149_1 /TAXON_ID=1112570 /ORGANISM="Thraustochytrium sp., Strain LLF1b" /LENGTH=897 /DNA_ID=CAMNT_0026934769 /DNA_START=277 /DNA_END=2970 /DNA_ORIENTATION=-
MTATNLRVTAPPAPKDLCDMELSTPVSVAPTVLKEQSSGTEHKSWRCLEFKTQVPAVLKVEDVDFAKLWQILAGRGWRYVNGDMEFANYYLAPGVKKNEGRLNAEKFGDANSLLHQVICGKDAAYRDVLEEYFEKFPPQFKPYPVQVEDVHWAVLWPIMRKHGWKSFSGGLLCPYLYTTEKVQTKQQATKELHKQAFSSSREATCFLLNNQTEYAHIMTEYFEKRPLPGTEMPTQPPSQSLTPLPVSARKWSSPGMRYSPANSVDHVDLELDDLFPMMSDDEATRDQEEDGCDSPVPPSPVHNEPSPKENKRSQSKDSLTPSSGSFKRTKRDNASPAQRPASLEGINRQKLFNFVWLRLKKQHGWTHSSGDLLHSFSFLKPGIRAKSEGTEGVDYFIGEDALVNYVCQHMPKLVQEFRKEQAPRPKERPTEPVESSEPTAPVESEKPRQAKPRSLSGSGTRFPVPKRATRAPRMTFHQVFSILREQGWTYRPAPDLLKNFYYLMPGVKSVREGTLGVDMFDCEEHVVDYYYDHIHDDNSKSEQSDMEDGNSSQDEQSPDDDAMSYSSAERKAKAKVRADRLAAKQSRKTKRNLFEASARLCGITTARAKSHSPASASDISSDTGSESEVDFNTIWPKLQKQGWKHFRGSGLISYYYAKPFVHTKSEGKLGVTMFDSEDAVVREYMRNIRSTIHSQSDDEDVTLCKTEDELDSKLGNFVWSVLRYEEGWLYRSGDKLSAFCYLRPPLTKKSDGVEGVDLFTGLGSLLKYVRENRPDIIERFESSDGQREVAKTGSPGYTQKTKSETSPRLASVSPIGSASSTSTSASSSRKSVPHDSGLFDFCWDKLNSKHGWEIAFVKRDADGEAKKVIVGEAALLEHVCSQHSSFILEYANQQKRL